MDNSVSARESGKAVKLSGKITNYRCVRASANFVVGVPPGAIGDDAGPVDSYGSDMDEPADYVQFDLDGEQIKGWVWRSPFKDGDAVDVACEWQGNYYDAYGIVRPADQTIALYPHCSRSKGRHIKNAIKWWAICNAAFYAFMLAVGACIGGMDIVTNPTFQLISGSSTLVFIPMFFSLARQFMPFVHIAEKIFQVLGLPDAKDMDLVRSSARQRTPADPAEFGTFYFRY